MLSLQSIADEIAQTMQVKGPVYSGEPIEFQWISTSAATVQPKFALRCGGIFGEQQNITPYPDSTGKYIQKILLETATVQQLEFELIVELATEDDVETQTISLPPITLFPASIVSFTANSEVALGDATYLTWQSQGKMTAYELKIGDQDWKKLSATTTTYRDVPTTVTTYQLRGYQGKGNAAILSSKIPRSVTTEVFYPEYKPTIIYPKANTQGSTGFIYDVALSPDNIKLYVATDDVIFILDVTNSQLLMSITSSIQSGPKIIAISSDGMRLYVADSKTRSLTIFDVNGYQVEKVIPIKIIPKTMVLSDSNAALYIGGENAIVVIDIKEQAVVQTLDMSENGKTTSNILALALNSESSVLYAADANNAKVWEIVVKKTEVYKSYQLDFLSKTSIDVGLNPRAVAIDDKTIYVLNTGSNTISVINRERSVTSISLSEMCDNPESMVLCTQAVDTETRLSMLYIAGGFSHNVVTLNPNQNNSEIETTVNLNPRKIVVGNDGTRIYAVCSDGVVSFWAQKRYIQESKILIPKVIERDDSFSIPLSSIVMQQQAQVEAEIKKVDEGLNQGPYGMFFPSSAQTSRDNPNKLTQNNASTHIAKTHELLETQLQEKLKKYKTRAITTDRGIVISLEQLESKFMSSFKSITNCFSQCLHKVDTNIKQADSALQKDAQFIHQTLAILLEEEAKVSLEALESVVIIISDISKDISTIADFLKKFGIGVTSNGITLHKS